jgi:hypothetical protein
VGGARERALHADADRKYRTHGVRAPRQASSTAGDAGKLGAALPVCLSRRRNFPIGNARLCGAAQTRLCAACNLAKLQAQWSTWTHVCAHDLQNGNKGGRPLKMAPEKTEWPRLASWKLHVRHVEWHAVMLHSTAPTSDAPLKSALVASTLRSDALSICAPLKDACNPTTKAFRV